MSLFGLDLAYSELRRLLQRNFWSSQHQLKWRSWKFIMALPWTDVRETYSSPDFPNLPSSFDSITYTLDVTVLHWCFCWFHSPFTLVASSMYHPYILLLSSSGLEGSCKRQSQVSCQTSAVRSSAGMVSIAIFSINLCYY